MADGVAFTILKTTKFKNDHNKGRQKRNEQTVPREKQTFGRLSGMPLNVFSRVTGFVFMIFFYGAGLPE